MANPYFNATYYLQNNTDLIAAGINTAEGAWAHYVGFGASEALSGAPSRSPAPWFDIDYYLSQNADLVTSGLTAGQLFEHFVNFGISEGRQPSANANVNSESLSAYAAANADLREAFGIEEGAELTAEQELALAQHFYAFGYAEPREGKPSQPASNVGETFNLTTSADNIVGTTGDDTIVAAAVNQLGQDATTLQAFDSIDGGAGRDTLNIYAKGGNNAAQVGTVKNVEVINLYNAEGQFAAGGIDASKFVGAEEIWQIGGTDTSDVNKLGVDTVAGYRDLDDLEAVVVAADTANSATIALDNITTSAELGVSGKALDTVNVSGQVVNAEGAEVDVELDVTAGAKVKTLNVNSTANVTLTAAGAALTAINAAESAGDITYAQADAVDSVTTGAGNDDVTITTATGKNVVVDTGAGDDSIDLTVVAGKGYNISAGEGNDTVTIVDGTVATTDSIDGGEGVDTIALDGKTAYVADDYIVLTKVLTNFEELQFTSVAGAEATAFDASKATGYETFTFDEGGFITKVSEEQRIFTAGDLSATAAGFVAAKGDKAATYAGALDITVTDDADITVGAESVTLTVNAGDADVEAYLLGDVQSASVVLNNALQDDDTYTLAEAYIEQSETNLVGLSSVTLSGNGSAMVEVGDIEGDAAAYNLVSIDASSLISIDEDGEVGEGLIYISNNTKAETIVLSGGEDIVALGASTYGATDVVNGFNAEADLLFVGEGDETFEKYVSTQTDLDLLLKEAAESTTAGNNLVFNFGGDTYVFVDTGDTALIEDSDVLVKLTGTIDLDDLIGAINVDMV